MISNSEHYVGAADDGEGIPALVAAGSGHDPSMPGTMR